MMKKKMTYGLLSVGALVVLAGCNPQGAVEDAANATVGAAEGAMKKTAETAAKTGDAMKEAGMEVADGAQDVTKMAKETGEEAMQKTGDAMEKTGDKMMEKATEMTAAEMDTLFAGATPVTLTDNGLRQTGATGIAWTVAKDGMTYHRVVAKGMPALEADYFYEGWLVKAPVPGGFFSTGEMTQNAAGDFVLEYAHDTDVSASHKKVVITLEPRDGDPAPAEHIIEN